LWWLADHPVDLIKSLSQLSHQFAPDYIRLCCDLMTMKKREAKRGKRPEQNDVEQSAIVISDSWGAVLVNAETILELVKVSSIEEANLKKKFSAPPVSLEIIKKCCFFNLNFLVSQ
jgi:hypothetical protein